MAFPQVVLITGCSKGIGLGVSLHLAQDPQRRFKVYATLRDIQNGSQEIKDQGKSFLGDTLFLQEIDVTKEDTVDKAVKDIIATEGKIDVLINNAGITGEYSWWEELPVSVFEDVMNTNFLGIVRMTKAVVQIMKKKKHGRIIQISSQLGFMGIPQIPPYVSSKFALEGFSEAIAPPLRKFNVWVTLLETGPVATPIWRNSGLTIADLYGKITSVIPPETRDAVGEMVANADVAGSEVQTLEEIGNIMKQVILSDRPDFRYQTTKFVKNMASAKLVDPTGNMQMDTWMTLDWQKYVSTTK